MRVAVCVYGQPRYVVNPVVSECFFKNVVGANPGVQFDFFAHYWFDKNAPQYFLHGGSVAACPNLRVIPETPQLIEDQYRFTRKLEEKQRTFIGSEHDDEDFDRCVQFMSHDPIRYPKNYLYSFLSTSYSLQKSVSLALEYSKEMKVKYDFGIITTFSTKVDRFPNLHHVQKKRIYSNGGYGPKAFLLNFLLSDFDIIEYRPYDNFKKYANELCLWHPQAFEGDIIHREIYRSLYPDEYITNHHGITVAITRDFTDTVGQY